MTHGEPMREYEVGWLIKEMSAGVPAGEKHRLFCANAAELYRFV